MPDTLTRARRRLHSVRTAIAEQALFDALIPIDPIIWPYPRDGPLIGPPTLAYALGALQRQTRWASRWVSGSHSGHTPPPLTAVGSVGQKRAGDSV